ncbi:MAG: hypothetical protein ACOC80_00625 [Petrotogales bacterium]
MKHYRYDKNVKVVVKQTYKYPVPTATEVKKLFDLMDDFDPVKIGMGMIAIEGCRPSEVCNIRWPHIQIQTLKDHDVKQCEVLQGLDNKTQHRVCLYSLRRFAFTFHYYVTFNCDEIALAKAFGHTRPDTTLQYYVQPKEAIGLTDKMIADNITIDQFIHLHGKAQYTIPEFFPQFQKRFTPADQKALTDY